MDLQFVVVGISVVVVCVYRMEVVNLMFAILGHVLASFLYLVRRIQISQTKKVTVDRSSILDRKEDLKQLWEKKMMAEEECLVNGVPKSPKGTEEIDGILHENKGEVAKPIANGSLLDGNGNSSDEPSKEIDVKKEESVKIESNKAERLGNVNGIVNGEIEAETVNNEVSEAAKINVNSIDESQKSAIKSEELVVEKESEPTLSQDDNVASKESEEKIYTSAFEQTLVITQKEGASYKEEQISEESTIVTTQEHSEVSELQVENHTEKVIIVEDSKQEICESSEIKVCNNNEVEFENTNNELLTNQTEDNENPSSENSKADLQAEEEEEDVELMKLKDNEKTEESEEAHGLDEEWRDTPQGDISVDSIEIPSFKKDDDSYSNDLEKPLLDSEFAPESISPDKAESSESPSFQELSFNTEDPAIMRDRARINDKMSRIHSLGVQKTEQPYNTCTTETKIAMEIREMREREEELKLMREKQALSPVQPAPAAAPPPPVKTTPKVQEVQKQPPPQHRRMQSPSETVTPGYRVSSVFGHRATSHHSEEESKTYRPYMKETPVEREIRLARNREEELRKEKGLPPREDDSYVKPSQVKSSQVKVFSKLHTANNARLVATTKIQHEIEEQTLREMALRETGHIQTISQERTDSKVSKLKSLEIPSPNCTSPTYLNGSTPTLSNGSFTNGHVSPDGSSKRSTPSPTGSQHSSTHPVSRTFMPGPPKVISMQKFIASRGKETTFAAPRNGPFHPKNEYMDVSRSIPAPGKLKRTVSVESKIQQEIMEMKQREEELKLMHSNKMNNTVTNGNGTCDENDSKGQQEQSNGQTDEHEELCPRRSNLIAQWEQRIQNAEGRA